MSDWEIERLEDELAALREENDRLLMNNKALRDKEEALEERLKDAELENEKLKQICAGKTCFADPQAEEKGAREMAKYIVMQTEHPATSVEGLMQVYREAKKK